MLAPMAVPVQTPWPRAPQREPAWRVHELPPALPLIVVGSAIVGAASTRGAFAGAAAVAAVAAGLAVLRRPAFGALLLVAAVPVLSGLRRGLAIPLLRPAEFLIMAVGAAVMLIAGGERPVRWRAFDWIALAYVGATAGLGLLDVLLRGAQLTQDMVNTMLGPLQFLLLYRAVLIGLPSVALRRRALALLLLGALPVSAVALMQKFGLLGVRGMVDAVVEGQFDFAYSLAGSGLGRATGPFPSWHALGGYLLIVLLVAVALLLEERQRVASRATLISVIMLAAAAMAATVSFAAIAGVLAGVLALAVWQRRVGRTVAVLIVASLIAALLVASAFEQRVDAQFGTTATVNTTGSLPPTLAFRWEVWTEQYLPQLAGRWATGYGPDRPPFPLVSWSSTESIYVEMLMRGGLALLAIYLALMCTLGAAALRAGRDRDPDRRAAGRALFAVVAALAAVQLIIPLFIGAAVPYLLWILAAIVLAPGTRDVS
jgi:hypothetical protein